MLNLGVKLTIYPTKNATEKVFNLGGRIPWDT